MMKRVATLVLGLATLAGCSRSGELVVQAAIGRDTTGAATGIEKLVIDLLPFDRDSLFEALTRQAPTPEPPIPPDLMALRDSLAAARQLWTESESQWNVVRERLEALSQRMQGMNRRSREYLEAFSQFNELDGHERALARAKDEAFRQYEAFQKRYAASADSIKIVRFNWEDEAFARYGEIVDSLLEATGRQIHTDTTAGGGFAVFRVPAGRWYVYTRYELPFEELYFNIPVQIEAGGPDTLRLTRDTAEIRPLL
ncbi:MAG: hypothetical protein ACREKI_06950 [Gemmatimonadota bacterium]